MARKNQHHDVRSQLILFRTKKNKKNFEKPLDNVATIWYNIVTNKESNTNTNTKQKQKERKENEKMVCSIKIGR